MGRNIRVIPPNQQIQCKVELPASKSISNRLLVLNWLSGNLCKISNLSDADDTTLLDNIIVNQLSNSEFKHLTTIDCGNAGTIIRFLTACLTAFPGDFVLTGSPQMLKRPIYPLVDALISLGKSVDYLAECGFPPLLIHGKTLISGNCVDIDPSISSQYISALMMLGSILPQGLIIRFQKELVSEPYIHMTTKLLNLFGVQVKRKDSRIIIKKGFRTNEFIYEVEPDWSSAAFWFQIAALSKNSSILISGLRDNGLQGDAVLTEIFGQFGVMSTQLHNGLLLSNDAPVVSDSFDYNFKHCPDLVPSVAVTVAALGIESRISGVKNLRYKESDRIESLLIELGKAGIHCEANHDDEIVIHAGKSAHAHNFLEIETYHDHRMAMAFAPLAIARGPLLIKDYDVVTKSYPGFWKGLQSAGFTLTEA